MVNWLLHSDVIWHHKSGPTLVEQMACCPTSPSHYMCLNQFWIIVHQTFKNRLEWKGNKNLTYWECIWECQLQNVSHLFPASVCQYRCLPGVCLVMRATHNTWLWDLLGNCCNAQEQHALWVGYNQYSGWQIDYLVQKNADTTSWRAVL